MDKRLYQAGIIAIPLKKIENTELGLLHPNFLVIHSQFDSHLIDYPNFFTGELEPTFCANSQYSIEFREVLQATETKSEEVIFRELQTKENLFIPFNLLSLLMSHSLISKNVDIINKALSLFSFRGVLSTLKLEVDENVLGEILAQ